MSKHYTAKDILQMAVNLQEPDLSADMDGDGKITPGDARLAQDGVDVPDPSLVMSRTALDRLMNAPSFRYDGESDPAFQRYREMYEAAGSRAAEDAFGLASTHTGGYGSSYASTAANDAYALYMDKLAAKSGELEQQAYDRYRDERSDLYRQLEAAKDQEDRAYARDLDAQKRQDTLAKEAADRQYRAERDAKEDGFRERELDNKDREFGRNSLNDLIGFAFDAAGEGDYSYLAALGVDTSALTKKDALAAAETYAKYGDLSGLEKMGVDVSSLKQANAMDRAAYYAEYGDLSELEKLGVNTASLKKQNAMDRAACYAKYGDLSGLAALGVDVSRMRKDQLFDVAALFAKYGNYSLLRLLV